MTTQHLAQLLRAIYAPRVIVGDERAELQRVLTGFGLPTTQNPDGTYRNETAIKIQGVWMAAVEWACKEAARQLATVPAVTTQVPAAEVRAQAFNEAAKLIDTKVYNYQDECGSYDHSTGVTEYPGNGAEWVCEMQELAEEIRALAQSSTADKASEVRAVALTAEDVQWVTNDNAELGVKIGNQFFFLYKGGSLIYGQGKHDDGSAMYWRPVFKREFGECVHPINYENPYLIGTVSLSDSDEWKILPAALRTADSGNTSALGEGAEA